jgi:hypothetical protein
MLSTAIAGPAMTRVSQCWSVVPALMQKDCALKREAAMPV